MSFEIAEYSDQTKANFIDSVSISWLSELVDSTTLSNFCSEHSLPDQGRSLFEEVDYENLSGVSPPASARLNAMETRATINGMKR